MIHASELLQLRSDTKVDMSAPTVSVLADNLDLIGISDAHLIGGECDIHGNTQVEISEGVDALLNTSVVERLSNLSEDIKRILIFTV